MKKIDTGKDTLEALENSKINNYIYNNIKKYQGKKVLEIGSGIGNISKKIIKSNAHKVILTDISLNYLKKLKKRFKNKKVSFEKYNLEDTNTSKLAKYKPDTIICLNVLEHVEKDQIALKNMYNILDKNGKLILLVPYIKFLYGELDKNLHHFRRYSRKELIYKIKKAGFKIDNIFYINALAILGWLINIISKKPSLTKKDAKKYDLIFPFIKITDFFMKKILGLSIICICKK